MRQQARFKRRVTWLAAIAPLLIGASTLIAGDGAKLSAPTFILRPTAPAAPEAMVHHPKKKSLRPARTTAVQPTADQAASSPETSLASADTQPSSAHPAVSPENPAVSRENPALSPENPVPAKSSRRSAQADETTSGIIFRPVEVVPLTPTTLPAGQNRTQAAIAKALAAQPAPVRHAAARPAIAQPATTRAAAPPATVAKAATAKPSKAAVSSESMNAVYQEETQASSAATVNTTNDNFAPIVSAAELPRSAGRRRRGESVESVAPNINLPPLLSKSPTPLSNQTVIAVEEPEAADSEVVESETPAAESKRTAAESKSTVAESQELVAESGPSEKSAKAKKEPALFGSIFATRLRFPDLLPRSARKAEAAK